MKLWGLLPWMWGAVSPDWALAVSLRGSGNGVHTLCVLSGCLLGPPVAHATNRETEPASASCARRVGPGATCSWRSTQRVDGEKVG